MHHIIMAVNIFIITCSHYTAQYDRKDNFLVDGGSSQLVEASRLPSKESLFVTNLFLSRFEKKKQQQSAVRICIGFSGCECHYTRSNHSCRLSQSFLTLSQIKCLLKCWIFAKWSAHIIVLGLAAAGWGGAKLPFGWMAKLHRMSKTWSLCAIRTGLPKKAWIKLKIC